VIAGPIAIYLGLRAQRRIRDSGGALGGHGVAMAGWITGIVATCIGAVILFLLILFVGLIGITGFWAATHATPTP
jgi:Na+-driven multidrug efflux pump